MADEREKTSGPGQEPGGGKEGREDDRHEKRPEGPYKDPSEETEQGDVK